mmetsp:Transcript_2770/g.11360  ORF Transcript_2770/g.11360 Transcript_2770/m.11360 type:complete len:360 (+) Transcript_2770:173-1252(+)
MAGMALLLLPLLLRLAPTDALAPRLVSRAHVRPAAKGWWRHAAARAKKDEDTEEEFTFDAAERARQRARENYEQMLGSESEDDVRRLVFDYDPDMDELPVPSEGLMADDSVIPAAPQDIEMIDPEEAAAMAERMEGITLEGPQKPLPMAGPSSPDIGVDGTEISMTLEGDILLGADAGGTLNLPDFEDFKKKQEKKREEEEKKASEEGSSVQVLQERTRQNLLTELELDPFADSDFDRFRAEEYDLISAVIGEGSRPFLGIPLPYLQTGHTMLLLIVLVCIFVDVPGNPLTELPVQLRDFLATGLLVTYVINIPVAILAVNAAGQRRQPKLLWGIKAFVLGGLALKELTEIEPIPVGKR